MTAPTIEISAYFDLSATGGDFLTLDSTADKGKLDNAAAILAGDLATDVTSYANRITIRRGSESQLFSDTPAGTASVQFNNEDRRFDPTFIGVALITEDGDTLVTEDDETLYALMPTPFVGNILPGKRFDIRANGVPIYIGSVEDWSFEYEVSGRSIAVVELVDALGQLARTSFSSHTTTASQTAGPRINASLDRTEVAFGANRALDTGVSTLQADNVSFGSNVLNYLQLVTRSDLGRLYASADNVLTFRDRLANLNAVPFATFFEVGNEPEPPAFSDDDNGIPFMSLVVEFGSERLFNRVGIDRESGTLQTVSDSASRTKYGTRSLSQTGLLLDSDAQSLEMANYLLGIYKEPELRVRSLSMELAALTAAQQARVLALDITSVVEVRWTPNNVGGAMTRICIVEGIEHQIEPEQHMVTLHLGDADRRSVFQLNDLVFGRLDNNVLAF